MKQPFIAKKSKQKKVLKANVHRALFLKMSEPTQFEKLKQLMKLYGISDSTKI